MCTLRTITQTARVKPNVDRHREVLRDAARIVFLLLQAGLLYVSLKTPVFPTSEFKK